MSDVVNQVFTGKNGVSIVGIAAITLIVLFDKVTNSQYKFSGKSSDKGFTLEPAGMPSMQGRSMQIIEIDAEKKEGVNR